MVNWSVTPAIICFHKKILLYYSEYYYYSLEHSSVCMKLSFSGFEEVGCVSEQRYNETLRVQAGLNEALSALQSISLSAARWRDKLGDVNISETKSSILK